MSTLITIAISFAIGYGISRLLSGKGSTRARGKSYGYQADIYQWIFENSIKTDVKAVEDLFALLKQYLYSNEKPNN